MFRSPFDSLQPDQQDQFEYVDSNNNNLHRNGMANGNNMNNPKNSMTQIDTISENLLVATPPLIGPPGSSQSSNANLHYPNQNHHHQHLPHRVHGNLYNISDSSWLEPWQIVNTSNLTSSSSQNNNYVTQDGNSTPQRNSPLIDPSASQTNNRLMNPSIGVNGLGNTNTKLITASPLELLLLISSIMFLVLLALAFTISYYCFRRRRRRHRSAQANILAAATASSHHHFNPKGPSAASSSATLLNSSISANMCDPNLIGNYGPPMKHTQQHYQQHPAASGRRQTNSTFWAPSSSVRGGRHAASEHLAPGGRRLHRQSGTIVGQDQQYVNRAFDYSESNGPQMGIKQPRVSGSGLHRRWPNESQLVDAHLRDAVREPLPQTRMSQFRVPDAADDHRPRRDHSEPNHVMAGSAAYTLVEPRRLRSSEQQVWHNFESSTSPSDDNFSGDGAEIGPTAQRDYNPNRQNRYVPLLNRTNSYIEHNKNHRDRQQNHDKFHNPDPLGLTSKYSRNIQGPAQVKLKGSNYRNSVRNNCEQQDDKQEEYVYWNEQKSYFNHELMQQHHRVSFAHQKHQYPLADRAGGALTSASSTTGDSGHSLPSSNDAINTGDLSDGSPPPQRTQDNNDPPRLVVKSIEDSFIKKFTEIESQEYMSRDTRQVLSLAEWRKCLADANAIASNQQEHNIVTKPNSKLERGREDDDDGSLKDDESWRDSGEASGSNLATTQLRSLSEVDISFAKPPAASNQNTVNRKVKDGAPFTDLDKEKTKQNSSSDSQTDKKSKANDTKGDSTETINSPDLIISPEYKVDDDSYQRVRQLQLRSRSDDDNMTATNQNGHQARVDSPSNSVSYV